MIKRFVWIQMSALDFYTVGIAVLPNTVSLSSNLCMNSRLQLHSDKKQVSTCPQDAHRSEKTTFIKTVIWFDMLMWERFKQAQNNNGNIYLRNSFVILWDFLCLVHPSQLIWSQVDSNKYSANAVWRILPGWNMIQLLKLQKGKGAFFCIKTNFKKFKRLKKKIISNNYHSKSI